MIRRRVIPLFLAVVLWFPVTGFTGTTTTPQIVAQTTAGALMCMRWMPTGVCFWLRCSWSGCSIRTSIKVGHYNPDLVVSTYNELGGNPWAEIRATLGLAQKAAATGLLGALLPVPIDSAGNRTEGTSERDHKNLVYRETDAIGHPLSSLSGLVAGVGLLCPSQTTSFFPYFQSGLDALSWRQEIPEIFYPASFIPGLRELGTWPLQTWGGVYPRTGWTTQAEEPKAAALNAQRAGDIVTRIGQPHVYIPVTGSSGFGRVWPPGPLVEKDRTTGTWQMLLPRPEASCSVFGTNDLASLTGWGGGRVDSAGDYAWNLWRPYQCCRRRGQWFLFSIDWMSYPP
ncbi:MAG: TIGR03756 family integrating conjugative element protein [Candidatus Thiodiazotropha endolucinida]|nr:TIGR03756 family integrating conjugative element protein [Candidatus Thiodiazotropha taylori]MCW4345246.1 TIGR03756 family integrating conjugative element protein [Candidatus Thiodiazotropha endolucinida]